MKLLILYHPDNEFATSVENFAKECSKHTTKVVETISLETLEGARLVDVYALVEYPSILVLRDDGQMVKLWQGPDLPLVSEVIGELNN